MDKTNQVANQEGFPPLTIGQLVETIREIKAGQEAFAGAAKQLASDDLGPIQKDAELKHLREANRVLRERNASLVQDSQTFQSGLLDCVEAFGKAAGAPKAVINAAPVPHLKIFNLFSDAIAERLERWDFIGVAHSETEIKRTSEVASADLLFAAIPVLLSAGFMLADLPTMRKAVCSGIIWGIARAHKHTAQPDQDSIRLAVLDAIETEVCEIVTWPGEETIE